MSLNRVRGKVLDHVVDTYADLPVSGYMGQVIRTKGFSTSVDGLGKAYQWDGAWVSNSIADLIVEDTAEIRTRNLTGVKQITLNTRGRPSYYLDSADTVSADDDFLVIVDAGGNRWKLVHNGTIDVRWAGAKGDGVTDDTVAVQKAIDAVSIIFFPAGVYKVKYLRLGDGFKHLKGSGNKNLYNRASTGITLSEVQQLGGTWIYSTSLTVPAISLNTTVNGDSGTVIEGLCFYQDHSDYSAPTAYQPCISDQEAVGYYSGIEIKNCMMINCNDGIELTHAERVDITDVNMDAFRKGIYLHNLNDVSKLERVHIWSFSQSALSAAFRQSASSDWAIQLVDIDELWARDVFIWDRNFGVYTSSFWGTLDGYTADAVAIPLEIVSPKGFASTYNDLKFNCNGTIQSNPAINITGTAESTSSVNISKVSVWSGGAYPYKTKTGITLNCANLIVNIKDINLKYFSDAGIRVTNAEKVNIDTVYCSNFIPNQLLSTDFTLETVGIRNTNGTANITVRNFDTNFLTFLFDGYFENVTFDDCDSVFEEKFQASMSSGTATSAVNSKYLSVTTATGDGTTSFTGMRTVPNNRRNKAVSSSRTYVGGVIYDNAGVAITPPTGDWRMMSLPRIGADEHYVVLDPAATSGIKAAIIKYTPSSSGVLVAGPFARNYTGTFRFYGAFFCESDSLVVPKSFNNAVVTTSAAPTSTQNYWGVGHTYYNSVPSAAGKIGWVCVTAGSPGSWKAFGVIDA